MYYISYIYILQRKIRGCSTKNDFDHICAGDGRTGRGGVKIVNFQSIRLNWERVFSPKVKFWEGNLGE